MKIEERLLQAERLKKIKEILSQNKTVRVKDLSRKLFVSDNTIRRDLIYLENSGACTRVSGGATIENVSDEDDFFLSRRNFQQQGKNTIAHKASKLIKSGMTIIIDSGTTAAELAKEIKQLKHITIITPSLTVANILAGRPELSLIMPGGIINPFSLSLTGEPAANFFNEVYADILFLAVKGISLSNGLTDHTITEASVKKQMIKSADKLIVLADHSKFEKKALYPICDISRVDIVVSDDVIQDSILCDFKQHGITIL